MDDVQATSTHPYFNHAHSPSSRITATTTSTSRTTPATPLPASSSLSGLMAKVRATVSWRWLVWTPLSIGVGIYSGTWGAGLLALFFAGCGEVIISASARIWTRCRNSGHVLSQMIQNGDIEGANELLDEWRKQPHPAGDPKGHEALKEAYDFAVTAAIRPSSNARFVDLIQRLLWKLALTNAFKANNNQSWLQTKFQDAVSKGQTGIVGCFLENSQRSALTEQTINSSFVVSLNNPDKSMAFLLVDKEAGSLDLDSIRSGLNPTQTSIPIALKLITRFEFKDIGALVLRPWVYATLPSLMPSRQFNKEEILDVIKAMLSSAHAFAISPEFALNVWVQGQRRSDKQPIPPETTKLFNQWIHKDTHLYNSCLTYSRNPSQIGKDFDNETDRQLIQQFETLTKSESSSNGK